MITVGIDVGFLTTKAAISEGGKVIAFHEVLTGDSGREASAKAVKAALSSPAMDSKDIAKIVSTGAGKGDIPYDGEQATEMLCDVKGALYYFPLAKTVIDMGAECVRVIRCGPTGRVLDFGLNDKCAAGAGIFLDVIAKALEIDLVDIGPLSLQGKEDIDITATCSVFAESEVVGLIARGKDKASILAGILKSVANRIYTLANRVGIVQDVIFIGGGAKNVGLVKNLKTLFKKELLIPQNPQVIGAIGAALIAQERSQ